MDDKKNSEIVVELRRIAVALEELTKKDSGTISNLARSIYAGLTNLRR